MFNSVPDPRLLKDGEIQYIRQIGTRENLRLLRHIDALYEVQDKLIDALAQVRITVSKPDGFNNALVTVARVKAIVDEVLGGTQ